MQIYVNSMNKSSILLMVLDWLTAQCSTGDDARYIFEYFGDFMPRIFNSWDKAWDKICIFWGEVAGGGDILRRNFDWRLFWEVDEGARTLGEHPKGFKIEKKWFFFYKRLQNWKKLVDFLYFWQSSLELSDGKILTTMEWLMIFAKVPL